MNSNLIHALSEYCVADIVLNCALTNAQPNYWYQGQCPKTGEWLRLPRTLLAERVAHGLMNHLAKDDRFSREGKMYGVLLVKTPDDQWGALQAFSGLLQGKGTIEGWVPPIPGRDRVAFEEAMTLSKLESTKQAIMTLQQLPVRQQYTALAQEFATRLQQLKFSRQHRKQQRQQQRQHFCNTLEGTALVNALEALDDQSRREGIAERRLKQERDAVLQPLKRQIDQADTQIQRFKQQRKSLSRQLQTQMHAAYRLTNFAGQTLSLQQLGSEGSLPTGTGDCCAPKLLHYAATHGLKPVAMAEFWWGTALPIGDKVPGKFYGACTERCQPLMGFLLSGLSVQSSTLSIVPSDAANALPIVYKDEWLIAVNKPAGLLSVPGRYLDRQDSVLSRLQCSLSNTLNQTLMPVHRLDQETSGILLLARDATTHRHLSRQFQCGQISKVYEAVLAGILSSNAGVIELPLWADPDDRPYQKVDWQQGKPSTTKYRILSYQQSLTRLEFYPLTGRTHQLRVHAAHPQGLGIPILGDRLYGACKESAPEYHQEYDQEYYQGHHEEHQNTSGDRLHLHARELQFLHPQTEQIVQLRVETPF